MYLRNLTCSQCNWFSYRWTLLSGFLQSLNICSSSMSSGGVWNPDSWYSLKNYFILFLMNSLSYFIISMLGESYVDINLLRLWSLAHSEYSHFFLEATIPALFLSLTAILLYLLLSSSYHQYAFSLLLSSFLINTNSTLLYLQKNIKFVIFWGM